MSTNIIITIEPILLDREAAASAATLSTGLMERLIAQGEFPRPRKLSKGKVGWLPDEIREWARTRPVSDLLPPANSGGRKGRTKGVVGAEGQP